MELFVCKPHDGVRLTRQSCASRHERVVNNVFVRGSARLEAGPCRSCKVGKANLRGRRVTRWEDGSPVVVIDVTPRSSLVAPQATKRMKKRQRAAKKARRL